MSRALFLLLFCVGSIPVGTAQASLRIQEHQDVYKQEGYQENFEEAMVARRRRGVGSTLEQQWPPALYASNFSELRSPGFFRQRCAMAGDTGKYLGEIVKGKLVESSRVSWMPGRHHGFALGAMDGQEPRRWGVGILGSPTFFLSVSVPVDVASLCSKVMSKVLGPELFRFELFWLELFRLELFKGMWIAAAHLLRSHASPFAGAVVDGLVSFVVAVHLWFCALSLLGIWGIVLSSFAAVGELLVFGRVLFGGVVACGPWWGTVWLFLWLLSWLHRWRRCVWRIRARWVGGRRVVWRRRWYRAEGQGSVLIRRGLCKGLRRGGSSEATRRKQDESKLLQGLRDLLGMDGKGHDGPNKGGGRAKGSPSIPSGKGKGKGQPKGSSRLRQRLTDLVSVSPSDEVLLSRLKALVAEYSGSGGLEAEAEGPDKTPTEGPARKVFLEEPGKEALDDDRDGQGSWVQVVRKGARNPNKGKGKEGSKGKGGSKASKGRDAPVDAAPTLAAVWKVSAQALGVSEVLSTDSKLSEHLDKSPTEPFVAQAFSEAMLEDMYHVITSSADASGFLVFAGPLCPTLDMIAKNLHINGQMLLGSSGGCPKMRKAWVITQGSARLPDQGFVKAKAPANSRLNVPSCVIRCTASSRFVTAAAWTSLVSQPGPMLRKWCAGLNADLANQLMDTWSWELKDSRVVQGLVRVPLPIAQQLVAYSGASNQGVAWFLQPLNWEDLALVRPALIWQARLDGEDDCQYLARVQLVTEGLGLAVGGKSQLALRVDALDPRNGPKTSVWRIEPVPRQWVGETVTEALQEAGFEGVQLISKYKRPFDSAWVFRACRPDCKDHVPIVLEDDEGQLFLEAVREGQRKAAKLPRFSEPLKGERRQRVGFQHKPDTADLELGQLPVSLGATAVDGPIGQQNENMEDSVPGDTKLLRKRAVVGDGNSKKARLELLPPTAKIHPNAGQGNCLFEALAQYASHVEKKSRNHRQIRGALVAWMDSHQKDIAQCWDARMPDDKPTDESFEEYLRALGKVGAWGGELELYAWAKSFGCKCLIVDEDVGRVGRYDLPNVGDGRTIVLKYCKQHWEWVECDDAALASLVSQSLVEKVGSRRGAAKSLCLSAFGSKGSRKGSLNLTAFSGASPKGSKSGKARTKGSLALSEFSTGSSKLQAPCKGTDPKGASGSSSSQDVTWVCDSCEMVLSARNNDLLCKTRGNHIRRQHPDEPWENFHPVRARVQITDVAPAGARSSEDIGWECGYCGGTLPGHLPETPRTWSIRAHLKGCRKAPRKATAVSSLCALTRRLGGSERDAPALSKKFGTDFARISSLGRVVKQLRQLQSLRKRTCHDLHRANAGEKHGRRSCIFYCSRCTASWAKISHLKQDVDDGNEVECRGASDRPVRLRYFTNKAMWKKASPEWRKVLAKVWRLTAHEQRDMSLSAGALRKKYGFNNSSGRQFAVCKRRTILCEASRKRKSEGQKPAARLCVRNLGKLSSQKGSGAEGASGASGACSSAAKKSKRKRPRDVASARLKCLVDWVLAWLVCCGIEPHPGPPSGECRLLTLNVGGAAHVFSFLRCLDDRDFRRDVIHLQEVCLSELQRRQVAALAGRKGFRIWFTPSYPSGHMYRGGLVTLVKDCLPCELLDSYQGEDGEGLVVKMGTLQLINLWRRPSAPDCSTWMGFLGSAWELAHSRDHEAVFAGDWNLQPAENVAFEDFRTFAVPVSEGCVEFASTRWSGNRCIDYLKASCRVRLLGCESLPEVFGDHVGVAFRLAWQSGLSHHHVVVSAGRFSPPDGTSRADWEDLVRRAWLQDESLTPSVGQSTVDDEWAWFCLKVERALYVAAGLDPHTLHEQRFHRGASPKVVRADCELVAGGRCGSYLERSLRKCLGRAREAISLNRAGRLTSLLESSFMRAWPRNLPCNSWEQAAGAAEEALASEMRRQRRERLRAWKQTMLRQGKGATAWVKASNNGGCPEVRNREGGLPSELKESLHNLVVFWKDIWSRPIQIPLLQTWRDDFDSGVRLQPVELGAWVPSSSALHARARCLRDGGAGMDQWYGSEVGGLPVEVFECFRTLVLRWSSSGQWPGAWTHIKQVHIPKDGAAFPDGSFMAKDLRPISVCSIWYRLLMSCVVQSPVVGRWLDNVASPQCYGAIRGRNVQRAVAQLVSHLDRKHVAMSLDYAKCFDHLHPELVLAKLRLHGWPEGILGLARHVWCDQRRWLVLGRAVVQRPELVASSLPQGDPLSPLGLVVALNDAVLDVASLGVGQCVFLDDRFLTAPDIRSLFRARDRWSLWSTRRGLVDNPCKTRILVHDGWQRLACERRGYRRDQVVNQIRILGVDYLTSAVRQPGLSAGVRWDAGMVMARKLARAALPVWLRKSLFRTRVLSKACWGIWLFQVPSDWFRDLAKVYRLVGGVQKKAAVALSTLLDGHGQDASFYCTGPAIAGLCEAVRHGLAFSVAGSINTWARNVDLSLRKLGWTSLGDYAWTHDLVGRFCMLRDPKDRVLHLTRKSWRLKLWEDFMQNPRKDSVACRGMALDDAALRRTSEVFRHCNLERAGVLVGASNSLAAYEAMITGGRPQWQCPFCSQELVPSWDHLAWLCPAFLGTRPATPRNLLQRRLGWATTNSSFYNGAVLSHLAKVRRESRSKGRILLGLDFRDLLQVPDDGGDPGGAADGVASR